MTNPKMRSSGKVPRLEQPRGLNPAYANMVRIAHTPSEIVFDFALKIPSVQNARVTAQVMMSPLSAKLFQRALAENLAKYEQVFGEVKVPGEASLEEYRKLFRPPESLEDEEQEEGENDE